MIRFTEKDDEMFLTVRVVPRASKSEVVGSFDGALKIRLAAPPVDGAANAELVKLLAKTFAVAKSDVEIVGGASSRTKQVMIKGAGREKLMAILQAKN